MYLYIYIHTCAFLVLIGFACLTGALGGVAVMLSAPVKGAMDGATQDGALGAVKGGLMGLAGGIIGGTAMAVGNYLRNMHMYIRICI